MSFSCKIILADRAKEDKTRMVYLQAIIDRMRAQVPLGFYLKEESFDERRQCVKASHPNHKTFNTELMKAIAKANEIASRFRIENKSLSTDEFKTEFLEPSETMDVIKFMKKRLALMTPELAPNTVKNHVTIINKLNAYRKHKKFGPHLMFNRLSTDMMQDFKNWIKETDPVKKKVGLSDSTADKNLKIVKQYLDIAVASGLKFKDPFALIKIKQYKTNRLSLSQDEVNTLETYYDKKDTPLNHKKLLRYFLFSCYTGLRISDIKELMWSNVHAEVLIIRQVKGKRKNVDNVVPINSHDRKFLPTYTSGQTHVFDTFADPTTNRLLKAIAAKCEIKKKITYHTSRHTFGSLFAEEGNIVALQKIMGHEDIKTTMGYVHTNPKHLIDAKKKRFGD